MMVVEMTPQHEEDYAVEAYELRPHLREVVHKRTRMVMWFDRYPTEREWLADTLPKLRTVPTDFDGDEARIIAGAKRAAIALGMKHQ